MHVLVIEDDPRLSEYLNEALGREGYTTEVCATINEVESYIASQNESPKLVILDRMLGREDGGTLIPKLNLRYPNAGILVLSSLDMPSEKARLIDSGAEDYLSKPFSLEELTARLRMIARRSDRSYLRVDSLIRALGNLSLDLKSQSASVGAAKLSLTRKEFQLLSLLMDSPGRVYNRFQILDRVWEIERLTESNVVETSIKNLRRKLEDAGSSAHIESRRNVGYWIEA